MPSAPSITAEQLLGIDDGRHLFELIEGRLVVMEPGGGVHGAIAGTGMAPLIAWILERKLGLFLAAETGFIFERNPDTVRAPDFAFIRTDRVPNPLPGGYFEIMPDFCVEVISQNDVPRDVHEKAQHWIAAGVGEVWVLAPKRRTLTVYLPGEEPCTLGTEDEVHATGPLAGFSHPVADFFV